MKPEFDLGIIGGGEAVRMALPALRKYGRVAITHKDAMAAQAFPEFTFFADADQLTNADLVGALYVATPVVMHTPFVEAAVRASIPALIEKPLCLNMDECIRLRPIVGARVGVAFRKRFSSFAIATKAFRRSNPKQPCHMEYTWLVPNPGRAHWKAGRQSEGGGVVLDVGSHVLDLFEHCLGRIVALHIDDFDYDTEAESEVFVRFTCSHQDGSMSHARIGWALEKPVQQIDFYQGNFSATWSKAPDTPESETLTVNRALAERRNSDRVEEYVEMFSQLKRLAAGKPSSLPTLEDGLRNMELICILQNSIHSKIHG